MDQIASKRQKLVQAQTGSSSGLGDDRISCLPDAILHHILSFLPTVDVVRTCLLSTRWKYLWKSVPALYFSDSVPGLDFDRYMHQYRTNNFQEFVDKVISLRDTSNIHRFYLKCNARFSASYLQSWISTITNHNLIELILHIGSASNIILTIPRIPFDSLTMLKISGLTVPPLPASICFPRLKVLRFGSIVFASDPSTPHVSITLPVLEDFKMTSCNWSKAKGVNFYSPSLKKLTVSVCVWSEAKGVNFFSPSLKKLTISDSEFSNSFSETEIKIDAKSLETLSISGTLSYDYSLGCLPSLVNASFDVGPGSDIPRIMKCFTRTCNVKKLEMSVGSIATLFDAGLSNRLQVFPHLISLVVTNQRNNKFSGNQLIRLLRCMPDIESLIFDIDGIPDDDDDDAEHHSEAEKIPECFLLKLKSVDIKYFSGGRGQQGTISYLLARTLEKMTISTTFFHEPARENEVLKWLLLLPRGSAGTKVILR